MREPRHAGIALTGMCLLAGVTVFACGTRQVSSSTSQHPPRGESVSPAPDATHKPRRAYSEPALSQELRSLRVVARSWYYASAESPAQVIEWEREAGLGGQPVVPLLPLSPTGEVVLVTAAGRGASDRVGVITIDGIPQYLSWNGQHTRIGTFGEPGPQRTTSGEEPPPTLPVIDHLHKTLPPTAARVHGIAWAYTALPDIKQAAAHSLRDTLGVVIPEQTRIVLTAEFGEPTVVSDADGTVVLRFRFGSTDFYAIIKSYRFGYEPAEGGTRQRIVPVSGDTGAAVGKWESVQFLSSQDPSGALRSANLEHGVTDGHWTLLAQGWENL